MIVEATVADLNRSHFLDGEIGSRAFTPPRLVLAQIAKVIEMGRCERHYGQQAKQDSSPANLSDMSLG